MDTIKLTCMARMGQSHPFLTEHERELHDYVETLTPEVVLGISGKDMVVRHALVQPVLACLGVGRQTILRVALEVSDVELVFRQLVDLSKKLP